MDTAKVKVLNISQAPQGVRTVTGVVFIRPGQSRVVELDEVEGKRAWRLKKILKFSDPNAEDTDDEDTDEPLDRAELKKQADELGIDYPKNVSTAKLKELVDAKLAS